MLNIPDQQEQLTWRSLTTVQRVPLPGSASHTRYTCENPIMPGVEHEYFQAASLTTAS